MTASPAVLAGLAIFDRQPYKQPFLEKRHLEQPSPTVTVSAGRFLADIDGDQITCQLGEVMPSK